MFLQRTTVIPGRHLSMLHKANAAEYSEKKEIFYPFKRRFLERYASAAGYDRQEITKKCRCDNGIWRPNCSRCWDGCEDSGTGCPREETCYKCNGTGIYFRKTFYLKRYLLNNALYHVLLGDREGSVLASMESDGEMTPVNILTAKITHDTVPRQEGRKAAFALLRRYETVTYIKLTAKIAAIEIKLLYWRKIKRPLEIAYWQKVRQPLAALLRKARNAGSDNEYEDMPF